jgi:two-component system phosphate regulon response regulator PhoB
VRSILYRFPDLDHFEQVMSGAADEAELEFGVPAGEVVEDGEWILAIFELGPARRATSAAARAIVSPDEGARLLLEPRDWLRLSDFARSEARSSPRPLSSMPPRPTSSAPPSNESAETAESASPGSLPATPRSPGTSPPPPRPPRPSGTGARVLIVDDDADIRDVVAAMLEAVGLNVVPVGSAEEALDRVCAERFDLLVLDWNLPRMTGLELCRILRKDPDFSPLPVLFLTANASQQDMVEALASGGDDYVVKPFRAPELGARIFSLLRRSRLLQA